MNPIYMTRDNLRAEVVIREDRRQLRSEYHGRAKILPDDPSRLGYIIEAMPPMSDAASAEQHIVDCLTFLGFMVEA